MNDSRLTGLTCSKAPGFWMVEHQLIPLIWLSTVVLNSRDWSEIIWLPKTLRFKNQPSNRLHLKKTHWNAVVSAVPWLNKAKT